MDFMSDSLADGRRFRAFTLMDHCTREGLALEIGHSMRAARVVEVLDRLAADRQLPKLIVVDNGPEFISNTLDKWAYKNGVKLHFIRPGKPVDNTFCESFNGRVRDEFFNDRWFIDIEEAVEEAEEWRIDTMRSGRTRPWATRLQGARGNIQLGKTLRTTGTKLGLGPQVGGKLRACVGRVVHRLEFWFTRTSSTTIFRE